MSDINQIASEVDAYGTRRKISKERYARLRAEVLTFAQGRVDGKHERGLPWLLKHGIKMLEDATGETIPHDVTERTVVNWLERAHPELGKVFRA